MVRLGNAEIGFVNGSTLPRSGNAPLAPAARGPHTASLWFYTDRIDGWHRFFKSRPIPFAEELYDPSMADVSSASAIRTATC
jgi:hypothetical protein